MANHRSYSSSTSSHSFLGSDNNGFSSHSTCGSCFTSSSGTSNGINGNAALNSRLKSNNSINLNNSHVIYRTSNSGAVVTNFDEGNVRSHSMPVIAPHLLPNDTDAIRAIEAGKRYTDNSGRETGGKGGRGDGTLSWNADGSSFVMTNANDSNDTCTTGTDEILCSTLHFLAVTAAQQGVRLEDAVPYNALSTAALSTRHWVVLQNAYRQECELISMRKGEKGGANNEQQQHLFSGASRNHNGNNHNNGNHSGSHNNNSTFAPDEPMNNLSIVELAKQMVSSSDLSVSAALDILLKKNSSDNNGKTTNNNNITTDSVIGSLGDYSNKYSNNNNSICLNNLSNGNVVSSNNNGINFNNDEINLFRNNSHNSTSTCNNGSINNTSAPKRDLVAQFLNYRIQSEMSPLTNDKANPMNHNYSNTLSLNDFVEASATLKNPELNHYNPALKAPNNPSSLFLEAIPISSFPGIQLSSINTNDDGDFNINHDVEKRKNMIIPDIDSKVDDSNDINMTKAIVLKGLNLKPSRLVTTNNSQMASDVDASLLPFGNMDGQNASYPDDLDLETSLDPNLDPNGATAMHLLSVIGIADMERYK
uniref:Uncharacterized protein n=1 Tax=Polytomella parva TaxID=51329 RepID=A0A7S0YIX9_9CHLO